MLYTGDFSYHDRDQGTGLVYAGGRLLHPEIGRWLSVDPLAEKYAGWSPYTYALDNPVNNFDLDGREVGSKGGPLVRVKILMQLAKQMLTFAPRERIDYRSFLSDIQGKSLHTLQTEADPERLFISAGGPRGEKYVIDPAFPNRTIDMRHFLVVGQHGMMFSNDPESKLILANFTGLLNEGYQLTKGLLRGDTSFESAFHLEDIYSNYLGSLFFSFFYDPDSSQDISLQLERFFQWWIETNKEDENEEENEDNQN